MDCSSFRSHRRFYLSKRIAARLRGEHALALIWHYHQDQQPHTDLPEGFPAKAKLEAAGYTALEDLEGASVGELEDWACLTQREAESALAAYAAAS
ncbi:MAG: hypothetical protein DIU78_012820 [Pseudomonadota bacterium]